MKISYSWLKEYIKINESPERLADLLTASGSEVKGTDIIGGDTVFEVEVTPNRADCQCYIGIAREVSAITGKSLQIPKAKLSSKPAKKAH